MGRFPSLLDEEVVLLRQWLCAYTFEPDTVCTSTASALRISGLQACSRRVIGAPYGAACLPCLLADTGIGYRADFPLRAAHLRECINAGLLGESEVSDTILYGLTWLP